MFACQHDVFPIKLTLKSLTHDRILNIYILPHITSRVRLQHTLRFSRTKDKQIVQCFLWLATVTNDDRLDACPFTVGRYILQVAGCRLKFNYNWKTAGTQKKCTGGRHTVTVT